MSANTPTFPIFPLRVNNDFMIALSGHYVINIIVFEGCHQNVTGVNSIIDIKNAKRIDRETDFNFGLG